MSISIKSPAGDVLGQGKSPFAKPPGTVNGEDGYKKRTPSSNGVPEITYDPTPFKPLGNIKTPGSTKP